jgi:hypothetical protein
MKYKYSKLYWFLKDFEWMSVYFSPFKFFLPKLYIGKTAVGVPYFLPRKWVKATPKRALKATVDEIREIRAHNKRNPEYKRTEKPFREIYDYKMKCSYAEPLKIGFSSCGLGWKTKWTSTDFRHEWNPIWSFVCFGYQIALIFRPEHDCHFWEMYLYYSKETKGTIEERLLKAKKDFPCVWNSTINKVTEKTCYWDICIKNKYLKT